MSARKKYEFEVGASDTTAALSKLKKASALLAAGENVTIAVNAEHPTGVVSALRARFDKHFRSRQLRIVIIRNE